MGCITQKSIANGHSTWLHYLFLGTVDLEKEMPKVHESYSLNRALKKSVHGARNLAIFSSTKTEALIITNRHGIYGKLWIQTLML